MYNISIVIPIPNSEENYFKIWNSIFNQSIGFEKLEIIFVGSSDNDCYQLVNDFSTKYSNVFLYDVESDNLNFLYNAGIYNSTSDYLMFLEKNDLFYEDACETLYDIISKEKVVIVSGNIFYDSNPNLNNKYNDIQFNKGLFTVNKKNKDANILKFNPFLSSKIFNKEKLIKNNILFNEKMKDIYSFILKSFSSSNNMILLNKPLVKRLDGNYQIILRNYQVDKVNMGIFLDEFENSYSNYPKLKEFQIFLFEQWFYQLLKSDLSENDLFDLYYKASGLTLIQNLEFSSEINEKLFIFDLLKNKDISKLLELSNLLRMRDNFDLNSILSKDLIFLFYGFDYEAGGLAKSIFNRVNLFSDKGHKITLLNVDPFPTVFVRDDIKNIDYIERKFRKLGYIPYNVNFLNIWEYYRDKNNIDNSVPCFNSENLEKIQISENYLMETIEEDYDIFSINYYNINDFSQIELDSINELFEEPTCSFEDELNIGNLFNKNLIKKEVYINKELYLKSFFKNGYLVKESFFTKDGFIYFEIVLDEIVQFILYDVETTSKIVFNSFNDFCDYFVQEVCLQIDEKPFLINDCSGIIPSFNNIPSALAYKIANIHSNPYLKPTHNYGCEMREISPLNDVHNLDAIITLTESQKTDFIKEFGVNNIFAIPNLIYLKDIKKLDKKNIEVDPNKISIFARISPEKNMDHLVKSFKKVVDLFSTAKLNIYGRAYTVHEKNMFEKLKILVKELNLENNVIFRGHTSNVYEEMRNSLATILVSEIEGLGMVIVESMANGTPVISYNTNFGPKDLISNNLDGFLIEMNDINMLAEKILVLLRNPQLAIEMGQRAQKNIFFNFDENKIYLKWLDVFKEAYINSEIKNIQNYTLNLKCKKNIVDLNILIKNKKNILKNKNNQIKSNNEKFKSRNKSVKKNKGELIKYSEKSNSKKLLLNNILNKQQLIKKDKAIKNDNKIISLPSEEIIAHLKTTRDFYQLSCNPKKRVLLPLSYLYIILQGHDILENIKLYNHIQKSNLFDVGYYLNKNPDISRTKWCKILNPQLHFICHGINENRKPFPYNKSLDKKEIMNQLCGKNV